MKKPIAILAASGLIALGGAAAVAAASDTGATTAPFAIVLTAEADSTRPNILADVLADLVTGGTINQDQSDKIVAALDARRTELRAARDAARAQMQAFLEDGVISADELAQLPSDSPLRGLGSILDDGQITQDELRSLRGVGGFGGRGHGFHGGPFGGLDAPATDDASPSSTDVSNS